MMLHLSSSYILSYLVFIDRGYIIEMKIEYDGGINEMGDTWNVIHW